ncbi:hypothetical protein EB796_004917 [Bugula neritina]|uniref:Uncharacterized protein n=1 Tax=Bugula neritina TaxID=10212 RepID=A0A7J7KFW5_BUGNE|nr:hypothetical protein EB796_004917 [Bugula neritina]
MTSGLEEFNGSLLSLEEKFNTAATVFSNVEKCYKWYCKFLSFAPQTEIETEFIAECRQYLEGDKGASPPEEWLNYILQELAAIDNEIYSTNATILIKRIRQIYSLKSDEKRELSLSEVKGWRDYLTEGFDSLHQQKVSSSAKKEEADVRQPSSLKKLRAAPKLKGTSVNNESGPIKIKKAVTRVEHGIDESQEEHRNAGSPIHVAENMSSNETQIGSSLEGKLDDSSAGGSKDMLVTAKTQGSALAEGRSALAEGHSVTAEGRPVTADGKNSKLLENTKEVVADKNQNKNPNRSSKKRKQMKRKKAKVEEDDIDDSCPLVDNCLSVCSEVIPNTPQTVNSSKGPTQTTISSKGPNQTTISSKGPDQTIISSKGPNQTISELSAQSSTTQVTKNATPSLVPPDIVAREELNILSLGDYVIPQNYNLPYHPVTNKEKIERICNSASPTPKQKLDMMSQLIEEGDESCFCVRIEKLLNPRERMTPKAGNGTREQTDKWTSVADFSEELSADITYPEHVYHWLSKQNSHAFSSRDNSNNAEDDQNSIKECIRRAERILDEDVPSFTSADLDSGPWRRPGGHTSGAFTVVPSRAPSKSGDSGITDLTSREAPIRVLIGQGQNRYASRESGIDSDATLYTPVEHVTTASRSVRPKEVPPLWSKR